MNEKPQFAILRAGIRSLQALACLVLLSLPAAAGSPWDNLLGCGVPDCIGMWCRDDYCPKKEPCVRVPLCFGCDDYCSKKEPCVSAPLCFGCDDYRKKCPPKVCSGPLCQFLRCGCGSPGQPCGCAEFDKLPCDAYAAEQVEIKERLSVIDEDQMIDEQLEAKPQPLPPIFVGASEFKLTK
jgi:hypothetical protein